ncbi:MAG: hypothetical protein GWN01_01335 [Nitrosopumilaceae archaeon]|nr:hypothetical protein [Nitrosopumilaceae archaeon]NIU86002.1 hypothetical protein [Nitrosopumilaceae archaeon]NIX60221.1 hypothetical protein [Nitrosopumilaceae archaeon]
MSQTKTIEVEIDGKPHTVEYKTSLKFGEIEKLRKQTYKGKNPLESEFDIMLYKRLLMESAIVKAPFNPKNYTEIYELDGDVVQKIEDALLEEFPLARTFSFLGKIMSIPEEMKD